MTQPLAISIVLYKTDKEELHDLLTSLGQEESANKIFELFILDNSPEAEQQEIKKWLANYTYLFAKVVYEASKVNLGFGRGHNHNFKKAPDYKYILILNQDIVIVKDSIATLLATAESDDEKAYENTEKTPEINAEINAEISTDANTEATPETNLETDIVNNADIKTPNKLGKKVGVWEMRQVPYEHPKIYDPITLETGWVAGAACLFRNDALKKVGGFDEDIFMYGEDVDISWRIIIAGYICRYVPKAPVLHYSYSEPGEAKRSLIFEGSLTHMLMRVRYGSWLRAIRGFFMLIFEIVIPQEFEGRRQGMMNLIPRYFKNFYKFRMSGCQFRKVFTPTFYRWDYSLRRQGVFFETDLVEEWTETPLVSIIIRTYNRPNALREALITACNQTYPNIEILVIEDGIAKSDEVITQVKMDYPDADIRYIALNAHEGACKAGNAGLENAKGEWIGFLDDDDLLFADHIQVLLQTAFAEDKLAVYSLAWEVPIVILDEELWRYQECEYIDGLHVPFSKVAMQQHNYFQIQSVLFHRSLYEELGGFDISIEKLEDWDLWLRYSHSYDFAFCEKTTSKCHVIASVDAITRAESYDEFKQLVIEKQKELPEVSLNAKDMYNLVKDYGDHMMKFNNRDGYVHNQISKTKFQRLLYRLKIKIKNFIIR